MKRQIAQLVAPRRFEIVEEEIPKLKDDEYLVKVISVGLCHSEVPAYLGESTAGAGELGYDTICPVVYPLRIGHEPVGVVAEVGKDVKKFKVGDYVTGDGLFPAFTSYMILSERTSLMTAIPKTDKPIKHCLGEPLACVTNIVKHASCQLGDYVAVIGCGMMGLLTIAGLKKSPARDLIAIDLADDRLALAEKYGATKTINPNEVGDVEKYLYDYTGGRFVDVIVEISGSLRGLKTAVSIAKIPHKYNAYHCDSNFVGRAKILMPTLYCKPEQWDPAMGYYMMYRSPVMLSMHPDFSISLEDDTVTGVELYCDGTLPLDSMVTHEFKLENINEGFEMLLNPSDGYLKGIVVPD